ncbi:hypothetical protein IE53DRAFT_366976 [Violaceomyces palustris]|uniref:Uncharacterized protein n=1 Tax=Violaceomyces palustris TaxID=1673888 RepID=A0ACD0P3M1_9BASI|nr:hypothetical protein IE53DRAFT_366976 [Violaceomyces palustris]
MADFYMRTALALDKVNSKKSSIKAAASTHSKDDTKRVLALLVNSLAFRQPLQSIIQSSQLRRLEAKVFSQFDRKSRVGGHGDDDDGDGDHDHDDEVEGNRRGRKKSQSAATKRSSKTSDDKQSRSDRAWNGVKDLPSSSSLILVLVHDLLLSSRGIQASKNWPPKLAVERHRARLHSELVRVQIKMGKSSFQELKAGNEVVEAGQGGRSHNQIVGSIPRWVRVNELKSDLESVKRWFQEKGWKLVDGEGDGPCFLIES